MELSIFRVGGGVANKSEFSRVTNIILYGSLLGSGGTWAGGGHYFFGDLGHRLSIINIDVATEDVFTSPEDRSNRGTRDLLKFGCPVVKG